MRTYSLGGKVAIITGASQGLGREIAERYARAGASVVICARDATMLGRVQASLRQETQQTQAVEAVVADVSQPADVSRLTSHVLERFGRIDVLVNNAGVYGPMGNVETTPWSEWTRALEVNVLGSVMMVRAVLPGMKSRRSGKIIQLSGGGATSPMPMVSAYAVSKVAIVRFAETLAEEVRDFGIQVNSIAPGALNTRMLDEVLSAGPERVGQAFFDRSVMQKETGGTGMDRGAALAVFLGSDSSDGITGKLISAVWDNWEEWPLHLEELSSSDAYTLRRIAGRDRGLPWGDR